QVGGGLGVNLRPESDGVGELPADVLDLGEQVEGHQVLRPFVENVRDLDFRVVELADLDENSGVPNPIIRRRTLLDTDRLGTGIRGHDPYSRPRSSPSPRGRGPG